MKKVLAIILAALMLLGALSACAKSETEQPQQPEAPAANEPAEQPAADDNTAEIPTITYTNMSKEAKPNDDKVAAALSEYTSEKYGFNVRFQRTSDDQMALRFAETSGDIDDVITLQSTYFDFARTGALLDITEYVENSDVIKQNVPQELLDALYVDGKLYGIPTVKEMATGCGVVVRKADVEKYGWDLSKVKGWADLEPLLQDIVDDPDTDITIPFSGNWGAPLGDFQNVNYIVRPQLPWVTILDGENNYKVANVLETEYGKEFVSMMYDWKVKGFIPDNAYGNDWNTIYGNALANGTVGIIQWTSMPCGVQTAMEWYPNEGELVEVLFGDPVLTTYNLQVSVGTINAKTKDPDAAFRFLEMINSDTTARDFIDYGIENENYIRNADGRIELTDTDSYSRESWQVANVLIPTLRASDPADKVELYQAYNAKAQPALTYGFMPDFSAVDAENAAVNAVWKTYSQALYSGTANPADVLDTVIQEMKTAGSDKIVAEIQAQLDAWLANK